MKSKHYGWQARWDIDQVAGLATHDTGLRVQLRDGIGVAENAEEAVQSLVATHGLAQRDSHGATLGARRSADAD